MSKHFKYAIAPIMFLIGCLTFPILIITAIALLVGLLVLAIYTAIVFTKTFFFLVGLSILGVPYVRYSMSVSGMTFNEFIKLESLIEKFKPVENFLDACMDKTNTKSDGTPMWYYAKGMDIFMDML